MSRCNKNAQLAGLAIRKCLAVQQEATTSSDLILVCIALIEVLMIEALLVSPLLP